jgi:DNA-binding CsgD family transcriptional regulator/PAS domain-containing protein
MPGSTSWKCIVGSELIELSSVIGDIYDAAIDPTLWKAALANVCGYVGGHSATLFWHDAATQNARALYLFNDDPEYTRLYFEKYVLMDPFFPASSFVEAGVVHGATDIIPQAELEQTRFYKEWIVPQGIADAIAVNLEKGVTRSSFIVVRTDVSYGMADDKMHGRLAALVPHLQRAVEIGRLFDQDNANSEALTETLDHVEAAVFLVGPDGEIAFANTPAQRLLGERLLVLEQEGALRAIAADTDRIMRDIFLSAERGDTSVGVRGVAVPLTDSLQGRWFAHVLPLTSGRRRQAGHAHAAVAAVLIRESTPNASPPLEAIAKLYKLTASEVRVLDTLLKAEGVKGMADILGLSQATVKTHLHNVFRKTGTKGQSDLVKLVAGI